MKHYLVIVWEDVEPEILGPFATTEERDVAADDNKDKYGNENGIFPLDISGFGEPSINTYSGKRILPDEEEYNGQA